jgi:hypothetical protein
MAAEEKMKQGMSRKEPLRTASAVVLRWKNSNLRSNSLGVSLARASRAASNERFSQEITSALAVADFSNPGLISAGIICFPTTLT